MSFMNLHIASPAAKETAQPLVTTAGKDLLRGLLSYRLYGHLGWLDIKRRYRRTVLGPVWGIVTVSIMIVTLGAIGVGLWHQSASVYLPFLTSGLLVWWLISTMLTEACTVFIYGQNFLRQVRLDYSILVYALVWRNVMTFFHNFPLYVVVMLIFAPHLFGWTTLLAVPGILLLTLNGAWMTLLLGMWCLRYRDVQQLVSSLVQISIYVTPIFWPPSQLQEPFRSIFMTFNPLYHLIEIVRAPLIGQIPDRSSYIAVLIILAVGWSATYVLFRRFRGRLAYWS
jgi:ABC-type polysaccharide/polyol phosphate export permease